MNDRSFGCRTCKTYTDAGYRWASYQLERPGIVRGDRPLDVAAILAAEGYWNPPAGHETDWNCDTILPRVRQFLTRHRDHDLVYISLNAFFDPDGPGADWVEWRGDDAAAP
jgi:hypothetical protein